MTFRGCATTALFGTLVVGAFGLSGYFSFKLFVRGSSIPTPTLVGRTMTAATAACSDLGILLEVDPSRARSSDDVGEGRVVWQSRRPGSLIKRGTRLYVAQSLGPIVLRVPDLSGETARAALFRFTQQNLSAGPVSYIDIPERAGVIATSPTTESIVSSDTPISILVGREDASRVWVMPDLINHSIERVRPVLGHAGLRIGTVRWEAYPGIADGTIIRQFPLPGHPVDARQTITLVASRSGQAPEVE